MKPRHRGPFLACFLAAFASVVGVVGCRGPIDVGKSDAPPNQPNILLVSLDACRADSLGCYGYSRATSPFIDGLAAGGTLFSNAFVNTHGTPPSHTTMLTSLYQETHGISLRGSEPGKTDLIDARFLMVQEVLRGQGYITIGVTGGGFMGSALDFDRGFIAFDDRPARIPTQVRRLLKFVRRFSDADRPIFVLFHTYEIHSPYTTPREYQELFDTSPSDFEPTSENLLARVNSADHDLSADDVEHIKAQYDAGIRYTDDNLRELFSGLEMAGFLDDAVIIITADHGEEFADHGGLLHRGLLYDELVRVPLLIWRSSSDVGAVDDRMVSAVDIAPTILASAGVTAPAEMEGRNLLSHDEMMIPEAEEAVFMQYGDRRYGIRTRQWKLVETVKSGTIELYNLDRDPEEKTNVAASYEEIVSALQAKLLNWKIRLSETHADPTTVRLSQEEKDQLEALGYVDGQNPEIP